MHILILLALCTGTVGADTASPSAARRPDANYFGYLDQARRAGAAAGSPYGKMTRASSVADQATPFVGAAALRAAPEWDNEEDLSRRFALIRDARTLISPNEPDFPRRAPWLYPDDGCYVRATVALKILASSEPAARPPAKIYVFGNLSVRNPYARVGTAYWWYHVAPLVRVGEVAYVLDPAIEPTRPLTVEEWIARQTTRPDSTQVAVCAPTAYTPQDRCDGAPVAFELRASADERRFLRLEWDRLVELGRQPRTELGENPPWR